MSTKAWKEPSLCIRRNFRVHCAVIWMLLRGGVVAFVYLFALVVIDEITNQSQQENTIEPTAYKVQRFNL